MSRYLVSVLLFFVLPAAPQDSVSKQASPAPDAVRGKELYVKYTCYACHGFDGHGGAGARLVPMKMLLPVFTAYIRSPRQMPAYRAKVISDAQLGDIWAYIKSIPESPAPQKIPLLKELSQ
jgi:mono/diheme cytochrome c family protein